MNSFRQFCHLIIPCEHFLFTASIHSLVIIRSFLGRTCSDRTCQHITQHITTYITSLSRRNALFWSPLFLSLLIHSARLYYELFLCIDETMIRGSQAAIVTSQHIHNVIIWPYYPSCSLPYYSQHEVIVTTQSCVFTGALSVRCFTDQRNRLILSTFC